jgi:pyridoxal phosphate enzyme (YggS family)
VAWHLIGHLQRNKARAALATGAVIETVDSIDLARRLDRLVAEAAAGAHRPPAQANAGSAAGPVTSPTARAIYLQVNVDADPAKAGFEPAELVLALPELAALPHLRLVGLMTVGRVVASAEAARPTFAALRRLASDLRDAEPRLGPGLSMGMSDDFEVAVEEGSTVVRVGRAIFGDRPTVAA